MAEWAERVLFERRRALGIGATRGFGLEICRILVETNTSTSAHGRDDDERGVFTLRM